MLNIKYKEISDKYSDRVYSILQRQDMIYPNIGFPEQGKVTSEMIDLIFKAKYPNEDKFI